jgi:Zn-dependent peptidase ImmA (M78 family)
MDSVIDSSLTLMSEVDLLRISKIVKKYGWIFSTIDQLTSAAENTDKIDLTFRDLHQIRAMTVKYNDKIYIGVNSALSEIEQVRSILHEVGHNVLHSYNQHSYIFICTDRFINYREMEADYFAILAVDHFIKVHCCWNFLIKGARIGEKVY